jgi:hypothetical protein
MKSRLKTLWEILSQEQSWIDSENHDRPLFSKGDTDDDHESGVIRALFKSRRHFKFKPDRFLPHTEAQVAAIIEMERKSRPARSDSSTAGAEWIRSVQSGTTAQLPACHRELTEIFQILLPV